MMITNFKGACYDAETPPCKGCGSRHAGCHGVCDKYASWNERHLKRKKEILLSEQMDRCAWIPSPVARRK